MTRAANGLITGKTVAVIATEEGVSRRTIERDLESAPAVRILHDGLIEQEQEFRAGFREALTEVRRVMTTAALVERSVVGDGETQWVQSEIPDNRARMDAVSRFTALLALGLNHAPQTAEASRTFIWSEFMTAYEERQRLQAPES